MNSNDYRLRAYKNAAAAKNDDSLNELDVATSALKSGGLLKVPRQDGSPAKDSVYRRVAKFLLLIGVDEAASVLKFLPQSDVEKIIPEVTTIQSVDEKEAALILKEFSSLVQTKKEAGGEVTAFNILEKAFGPGKAGSLMQKVESKLDTANPFTYLKEKTPEEILALLKGESGQIMALVLSYLEPKQSASVINAMKPEDKKDVVLHLAKMKKISPDVIQAIDKTIHAKAKAQVRDDSLHIDGRGALAQILKRMELGAEQEILDNLERTDPELSHDLQQKLFTLDDVAVCDDKFLQKKLSGMTDKEIAYLIAGKDKAFTSKIFANVSTGRGDMILEEEAAAKPMLKKDVDVITKNFLAQLRAAWEKGDLIVRRHGDDEIYVD